LTSVFDQEFKRYLHNRGVNIDSSLFELRFQPPQNFASYRQAEVDGQRINTFNTIQAIPFISKRFALKRFLGMTEEEIAENERLWREEKGQANITGTDASGELRSVGAAGIDSDLELAGDTSAPDDLAQPEGAPPPGADTGAGATAAVAPPPAAPA